MFNDRFAQLLALKMSGEASGEELQELQQFLVDNPEAEYFFQVFSEYWTLEPRDDEDDIQEEIHFQQILAIAEKSNNAGESASLPAEPARAPLITLKRFLVAASILVVITASYFLLTKQNNEPQARIALNEVEAARGIRSFLSLPDGTRVYLNSDSKLEYLGNFNDSVREVTLTGEAYFDVVKDKTRPFIVHAGELDVRVLGTSFNVKNYPSDSVIEATLIHGLIEVSNKQQPTSPKVLLHPHEKLVYTRNNTVKTSEDLLAALHNPILVTPLPRNLSDSAIHETSWVYNKLIFDGERFAEIAERLERWYNVKIELKDEEIANTPIHFKIENESIEEVLKALQYIEKFNYKIHDNEIEITSK